jgi:flavorubredoxin
VPQIVILYDSLTGTTEHLAKAVTQGVRSVKAVDLQLLKIGTKFSISTLNNLDVLIVGSPSIYSDMTLPLRTFLKNLTELSQQQKLQFTGTKGAVFGVYQWDGGWHVDRMAQILMSLDIELVVPPLAIVDHGGEMRIHPQDLQRGQDLGEAAAMASLVPRY